MSGKTTTLLTRVDFTLLWTNNIDINKVHSLRFKLVNLLIYYFKLYYMVILNIKFFLNFIRVFVFNKNFKLGLLRYELRKICKKHTNLSMVTHALNIDKRMIIRLVEKKHF